MNGGKLVHMYKWDAGDALQLIERERITSMSGVPVMSRELISPPDFSSRDTSSLMSLGGGGAQLQPDLVGKIDASVATARPGTGYGMTETCGIITSIGSAATHFEVMEHPDTISKAVLERGLDAQTAFQIVSIDIADIEVGENIGARLQADQAEADTRVARAKAEERRAVAIAREQEMKAATAENRARVLQAEALVPKSIGEALRAGRMQSQSANGQA